MMISKDEAIALIEARLQKQERVIVALDGMSCSGKSTFAKLLNFSSPTTPPSKLNAGKCKDKVLPPLCLHF